MNHEARDYRQQAMKNTFRFAERFFPFVSQLRAYNRVLLRADFFAGLTVALVLIPQSMAYAQLAGLPAHYGLYAALLPPVVGALFGSSRQLATGPVAVISLMTAASLEPLATAGSEAYVAYAILLALIVGGLQFLLGVLRLGLVVNFLSHPVVNGFTNAAALVIIVAQLPKLFGIEVDGGGHPVTVLLQLGRLALFHTHWPTFGMGLLAIAIIVSLKRLKTKIPYFLAAVTVTCLLSWSTGFERRQEVQLSAIAAPGVQAQVYALNAALRQVAALNDERAALTAEINALAKGKEPGGEALLSLRYQRDLLALRIEGAKREAQQQKAAIKGVVFVAKEQSRGVVFFPQGQGDGVPAGAGPLWRLKVGAGPLVENSLVMTGGGAVVGAIPQGIPSLRLPDMDWKIMVQLLPYALIISLLGFMESISIARAMAAKTGQKLDPNQELIGQGLANMVGAFGSSYATAGSFSRSAVTLQAGGKTGIASVLSAFFVVLTLLFLTPLLYHLPQAVLAAIIIMAVSGLMQARGFLHAWQAQRSDGVIAVLTFASTLAFAPHFDKGILIGVLLSVAVFLYKRMHPKVATLAMSRDKVLQCADEHRLQLCSHIAAVRFDGSLFFANASRLDEQVFRIRSANPELRYILLVADGINDMDSSGEETLALLVDRVRSAGLGFAMCRVKGNVLAVLRRTGLMERIGTENIYASEEAALEEIIARTHGPQAGFERSCVECPLAIHLPKGKDDPLPVTAGAPLQRKMAKAKEIAHEVVGSMAAIL